MKITVVGSGYVGLVTGACLADVGNDVLCVDVDTKKIDLLRAGGIPIYEPGLQELVRTNVQAGRLAFTTDVAEGARFGLVQFIAVGTPPDEDGSADLQHVLAAANALGRHIRDYCVIVGKSTVPVGTADRVRQAVRAALDARGAVVDFAVVSNPEFLKEGAAIADFMRPDRIVIGSDDARATEIMRQLYAPFERNHGKLMAMDIHSAELAKYAANAMLATRISFMNELALLAERLGADIDNVRRAIGADPRIGTHFLYAGCGYGGSCFPKDVHALIRTAERAGVPLHVLPAVELANETQKRVLADRIVKRLGADLTGMRLAVWGLAFKPNTDDVRQAPSVALIDELLRRGAAVCAYDPAASDNAARLIGTRSQLSFAGSAMEAVEGADGLAIVTEWKEFRSSDLQRLRAAMRQAIVFDGRNILDPQRARAAGLEYSGIGRS